MVFKGCFFLNIDNQLLIPILNGSVPILMYDAFMYFNGLN